MVAKYLPLGTVCTLKGKNKKVMIIGYYSVEYKGNLIIKDYRGCCYPEGLLLPEQLCSFNHVDIEKVDFLGFESDEQKKFKNLLNRLTGNDDAQSAKEFHQSNKPFLTSSSMYKKLLFDENGVVILAEKVNDEEKKQKNKEDKSKKIVNPFNKMYKNNVKVETNNEDSSDWKIFDKYKFDKDGVLIDILDKKEPIDESDILDVDGKYKFDKDGVLIEIKEDSSNDSKIEKYEFDENGVVIKVNDN